MPPLGSKQSAEARKKMSDAHRARFARGEHPHNWKGGSRYIDKKGYVRVEYRHKMIFEHRLVMAEMIGRPLRQYETVHHINGNRADNRPENLELWATAHPRGVRVELDRVGHRRGTGLVEGDLQPE